MNYNFDTNWIAEYVENNRRNQKKKKNVEKNIVREAAYFLHVFCIWNDDFHTKMKG